MRQTVGYLGSLFALGTALLTGLGKLSNVLGILGLPDEVKSALILMSSAPTIVPVAALIIGLFCAGYLVVDSGHHTLALAAVKKRNYRVEPQHIIILGLAIALIGVIWQWGRTPTPDPLVSALQSQVEDLSNKLAQAQSSPQAPSTAAPTTPVPSRKKYTSDEANNMIKALTSLQDILNRKISPAVNVVYSLFPQGGDMATIQRQIRTMGMFPNQPQLQASPADLVKQNLEQKATILQKFIDDTNAAEKEISGIYILYPAAQMQEIQNWFDISRKPQPLNDATTKLIKNLKFFQKSPDLEVYEIIQPTVDQWTIEIKKYSLQIDAARRDITPAIQQLRENL